MYDTEHHIPSPPQGLKRLTWLGPGFIWMVSAAGSGEMLFTPRVGALYGYTLIWALLIAVSLKWFINREIGRYTVCTGKTILEGYKDLPGPRNWAVWLIILPQLFVAVSTLAGLAAVAATALLVAFQGYVQLWMIISIVLSSMLVLWGHFSKVELVATALALILGVAVVIAAFSATPDVSAMGKGLIPNSPTEFDVVEILPWLGFILSGAAGMIWYSYWIQAKGYGVATKNGTQALTSSQELLPEDKENLQGWLRQMTLDNTVAVIGTLIITMGFLILGTEFLRPAGLVPEENETTEILGKLLEGVWGPIGFWFMVLAVFVGFWDTVLSDQDGFMRMFVDGTRILLKPFGISEQWLRQEILRPVFLIGLLTVLPIGLYLVFDEPVGLLKIAGAIEAAHIPFLVVLTLYVNQRTLPKELRPAPLTVIMTVLAGIFFALFTLFYVLTFLV